MSQESSQTIKKGDFRRFTYLVRRYTGPYWKGIGVLVVINLLLTVLTSASPLIMAPILDIALGNTLDVQSGQSLNLRNLNLSNMGDTVLRAIRYSPDTDPFRLIVMLGGIYALMGVLAAGFNFLSYVLSLRVKTRAWRQLQRELFEHVLSLSIGFFTKLRTGELLSRLENDTNSAVGGLKDIVGDLVVPPLIVLFYGTLLVRTSYRLALAALAAGVFHYLVTRGLQLPLRRRLKQQFSALANVAATLQEAILSIRVVKSFSAERYEVRKLSGHLNEVARADMRFGVFKHGENPVRDALNRLIEVAILLLAASELLSGRLDAATFFLYLFVGRAIMPPIAKIGSTFVAIQQSLAASERIFELLSTRPQVDDGPLRLSGFEDRIVLDGVSFSYEDLPVLQDVSLEVHKGEKVALVGPSGAGKSTLVDLVLRFYDPGVGRITFDGHDLRELHQESYRRLFGVVSQESLLFNASVRDNILYGRDELTEDDVIRAAQVANAHDFILELPEGYDTYVGDRGIRLSGGQRQRIAIARAVAARPHVLVLDEATSSLDSEAELLVQQAIERAIEDTTAIIIAHRLSTVVKADRIVVLNRGRVEAIGPHEELLLTNETYRRLYRLQFEGAQANLEAESLQPEEWVDAS